MTVSWMDELKAAGFRLEYADYYRVRRGEHPGYTTAWHCYEGDAWAEARRHYDLNRPDGSNRQRAARAIAERRRAQL